MDHLLPLDLVLGEAGQRALVAQLGVYFGHESAPIELAVDEALDQLLLFVDWRLLHSD